MTFLNDSIVAKRRSRTAEALDQHLGDADLILIFCGEPVQKPGGLDQTYDFLPHPEYFWLTGSRRPLGVLAYGKREGWIDFVNPISQDERLWEGSTGTTRGLDVAGLSLWIENKKPSRIFCLGQPSPLQKTFEMDPDSDRHVQVQEALNQVRRVKDETEIQWIREIAQMASRGYELLAKIIRPGISERQIQIEYEAEVFRAGAEKMPYGTIVGAGTNAAVLHAVPTPRIVQKGELVLVDAGADRYDYCVDITRVFAADGVFNSQQKELYNLVLSSQLAAIQQCRPGVEWREVHKTAARVLAEGLKTLGLLKGETEILLDSGAISVFFPHGVGHMVGLKVRDVGGRFKQKPHSCCGVRLRVDLNLEENFVMTVEPGIYFVQALIDDPGVRSRFQEQVNWSEVEKWRHFGGVRIEDDVLVTAGGPQVLTDMIPK